MLAPALLQLALPGTGCAADSVLYEDTADHFSLAVPSGWDAAEGTATGAVGTRRVLVWHEKDDLETNVNVITTNASVELTKISSLGTPYEFGFHLVQSQTRGGKRKQVATLLNSEARGDCYWVEVRGAACLVCSNDPFPNLQYKVQRPEDGVDRHLYSLVALRFDGLYNRLFTVTGQHRGGEEGTFGASIADAVGSFKLTPLPA